MKINTTQTASLGLALFAALLTAACSTQPSLTEQNFGESVRQMIRAQTYDPGTLSNPSTDTIEETDGQLLEGVLEAYRGDVAQPSTVGDELQIGVGGGQR